MELMDRESQFYISSGTLDDLKPVGEIFDLSGKVAVVTGTVGLAMNVIYRLASCGAKVVCGARGEDWGQMLVDELADRGLEILFKPTDVSKKEDCEALVAFAEEKYGPVDIVVPVAATWEARAFVDVEEELWDRVLDTDLKGEYFLVQAAARSMIRAGKGGKVVTIASVAHRGDDVTKVAMMTPYNAAKAGVVGMTIGIAKELKQYGINVNCVAPGGMLTPGAIMNNVHTTELYGPRFDSACMKYSEVPISQSPDEVALMILTMCTDVSNFMYGQLIEVDGGSQFSFQADPWSCTMPGGLCAGTPEE